jgi:peptidoglycan-N-acetylglucosamine deacetylase
MKKLSLTFDDGPSPFTAAILGVLLAHKVPATFFMIGSRFDSYADALIRNAGQEIGNHTYSHSDLVRSSIGEVRIQISHAFNPKSKYFRPPYGNCDDVVLGVCGELGLQVVLWDCDSFDYALKTADEICAVLDSQMNGEDAIILLHDGDSRDRTTNRWPTVEATNRIITKYKAQGFEFVPLSEMELPGKPRKVSL